MDRENLLLNIKLALPLLKLCELSYSESGDIFDELLALGFKLIQWNGKAKELNSYICTNGKYAVLVFQGTKIDDTDTLIADSNLGTINIRGYKLHKGVYNEYLEHYFLFKHVIAYLGIPCYVTGHSLGGALAGMSILLNPELFVGCYTFGAMRFCDSKAAKVLSKNTYRFVHENDIIPLLPFGFLGFSAAGKLYQIDDDGEIYHGLYAYLFRIKSLAIPLIQHSFKLCKDYINNHKLKYYIKSLYKKCIL